LYQYLVDFAGAGATVPISGFGYLLANGAMQGARKGLFGAFTGALSSASGTKIVGLLNDFAATCTDNDFNVEKYNAVKTEIENSGAKKAAVNRMLSDLAIAIKSYTVLNKELDLSDLPDTPDVPDYSVDESTPDESTPDESTPDENNAASADDSKVDESNANGESNGTNTETEEGDYTVIIIVSVVVVIAIAFAAIFLLKKKGNR
jgi:hypothetical protein